MLLDPAQWQLLGAILSFIASAASLWNIVRKWPEIRAFIADRLDLLSEIKATNVNLGYATTRATASEAVASGLGTSIASLTSAMHEMKEDLDSLHKIEERFDALAEYVRELLAYAIAIEAQALHGGLKLNAERPAMPQAIADILGGNL